MSAFIRTFDDGGARGRQPFDVAVVMPTVLRPEIAQALRSIFAQNIAGRVQVLIGIDRFDSDISLLDTICAERPANFAVQVFYPGYSTSVRHGGLSPARDGGVLRCVLSYLANSAYVAYLDDDNWWRADHLKLLRDVLARADWAYALRWFVHPVSRRPVCVDRWESCGPGRGLYQKSFGGFVDPSCLMLNKLTCEAVLPQWNRPLPDDLTGMSADRNVFDSLRRFFRGESTFQPTVYYALDPRDDLHPIRLKLMGSAYDDAAGGDASGKTPPGALPINAGKALRH